MSFEIFEYRRQARGPMNYFALALVIAITNLAWQQGWAFMAILLCGPFLAMILVRLIENDAEGFRMNEDGLYCYAGSHDESFDWYDLQGVTISGDGAGGAVCILHLAMGETMRMPATSAFSPERLAEEFRLRGLPVWRAAGVSRNMVAA
ncbi:MAG: hypothetical protein WBA91_01140 [Paracoccaceae bacterium]